MEEFLPETKTRLGCTLAGGRLRNGSNYIPFDSSQSSYPCHFVSPLCFPSLAHISKGVGGVWKLSKRFWRGWQSVKRFWRVGGNLSKRNWKGSVKLPKRIDGFGLNPKSFQKELRGWIPKNTERKPKFKKGSQIAKRKPNFQKELTDLGGSLKIPKGRQDSKRKTNFKKKAKFTKGIEKVDP